MEKTIIFDWSGTLNNNFDGFCQVYELMRKELGGKPLSKEEIKETFTLPYMKFWNAHFPSLTKEDQDRLYLKFVHQTASACLYPNAKEILEEIHSKEYKILILSSDPLSRLIPEIEKAGVSKLFTEVFGNIYEKEYSIKEILEKYNLNKENVFYVGDTSGDIEAGKKAGVKTIGISWGFQSKEKLFDSKPDYLIEDIIEIKTIID